MLLVKVAAVQGAALAQVCPLRDLDPASAPTVLSGHSAMVGSAPPAFSFLSKVERDDDGAPTAYHRGLVDDRTDPGLDHVCVGGSVLDFAGGRLHDRYAKGGSVGALAGKDPATGLGRSAMCKRDYIAIRDAGFPACGPGALCMIWYGIAAESRSCGFESDFGGADDKRCGAPIRQTGANGQPLDFYLTTTALRRPGSPGDTRVQSDYVNAAQVPYVVVPGRLSVSGLPAWAPGDLALMVWHGRTVYAVVGDTGPKAKIGEASRAALAALQSGAVSPIDSKDPAATVVFPGTAAMVMSKWPLSAATIETAGRELIEKSGGRAAWRACRGLAGLN